MVAATRALRVRSAELLRTGIATYLLACIPVRDWRDVLLGLAPFHDCARRIGEDPAVIFDQAGRGLPPEVASLAREFGKRTDVTPTAFGFQVVDDDAGPAYRVGPPW